VRFAERYSVRRHIGELVPCGCQAPKRPGVVLDPFGGVATTALVAERLGRDWLLVEPRRSRYAVPSRTSPSFKSWTS
jgi:hypothetical protein